MPTEVETTDPSQPTGTAEHLASDLPVGRPPVDWAVSPVMRRLVREVTVHHHVGGPSTTVGTTPYVPAALQGASRVVVIGRRHATVAA
jgi:hypothetical protein